MTKTIKISNFLWFTIFLISMFSCNDRNEQINAIVLKSIRNKTSLKNHSNGVDYLIKDKNFDINAELIIEPGVEILVESGVLIRILENAVINWIGTEKAPIILKSKIGDNWQGIKITSAKNIFFKYVQLQNISSSSQVAAIELLNKSHLKVENCNFQSNPINPFFFVESQSILTVEPLCEFENCLAPVQMELGAQINASRWTLLNVIINGIIVKNKDQSPLHINSDITLKYSPFTFYFMESVVVSNAQFTIDAGVKIKMPHMGKFETTNTGNSNSSFLLRGTISNPISISAQNSKYSWSGFILPEGNSNFFYTYFRDVEHKDPNFGVITLFQSGNSNFKNCDFKFNKTKCSIIILDKQCKINSNAFEINKLYNNGICYKF